MREDGRQYLPMYFDFLESRAFTDISGNALKLYLRLRRYVCRARSNHSLADFYIKGYLAVSGYLQQYADFFKVGKTTIARWIKELEDAKFLITYRKAMKGRNEPNIWILGKVTHYEGSQYGEEAFFIDHDARAQEQDGPALEVFDQARANILFAKADIKTPLTVSSTVSLDVSLLKQSMKQQTEPSNREDVIDKTNREDNIFSGKTNEKDLLPPDQEPSPSLEDVFPRNDDPAEVHRQRAAAALDRFYENQGQTNWAVPAAAGGASDWDECVNAFAAMKDIKPTGIVPATRKEWGRALEKIAKEQEIGPAEMMEVLLKLPISKLAGWKDGGYSHPGAAKNDIVSLVGQMRSGGIKLDPKKTEKPTTVTRMDNGKTHVIIRGRL